MINKSLKLNAILNTVKTITTLIFPLITFPYVSRILLPEGTGKVNFANSIIAYFSIIASLGISTYASREAAKLRDDKIKLTLFVKEILSINFISTFIAYILFFICLFTVKKFSSYKTLLFICSFTIILSTIGVDWLNSAMEDYGYITARTILFQIISIILIFSLIKTKDDYIKYAFISVISSMGANILNFIHSRKYVNYFSKSQKLQLKRHIKPVFILFGSSIAISIFTIMDTSMLGFLSTNVQVGYYSAASKLVRMIRNLFPAVFTVLFARFSYYYSKDDNDSYMDLAKKTTNFIFCFSMPVVTGFILYSSSVIELLCGSEYMPATKSVIILSPLIFISSCSGFLGGILMITQGKEKQYLYTTVGAAIIDLILNIIFIPSYGAFGASFATLLTELFIFIIYVSLSKDILLQIHIGIPFLQYLFSTFIMTFVLFFFKRLISNTLLNILCGTIIGVVIYALCLRLLKNDYYISSKKELFTKIQNKLKR